MQSEVLAVPVTTPHKILEIQTLDHFPGPVGNVVFSYEEGTLMVARKSDHQ